MSETQKQVHVDIHLHAMLKKKQEETGIPIARQVCKLIEEHFKKEQEQENGI